MDIYKLLSNNFKLQTDIRQLLTVLIQYKLLKEETISILWNFYFKKELEQRDIWELFTQNKYGISRKAK